MCIRDRAGGVSQAGLRGRLLQRLIVVEINRDDLAAASEAARAALDEYQQQPLPDHQRIASVLSLQGTIAREHGDLDLSLDSYSNALAANRTLFGKQHHSVALTLANVAAIRYERGDYEQSATHYREAIAINESWFDDPQHFQLFTGWRGLAKALRNLGELAEAEQAFRAALKILLTHRDETYQPTQQLRAQLAEMLWLQGKFDEAMLAQERAPQLLVRGEDAAWRCRARSLIAARFWYQRGVESRSIAQCISDLPLQSQWRSQAIHAIAQPDSRLDWHRAYESQGALFEAAVAMTAALAKTDATQTTSDGDFRD